MKIVEMDSSIDFKHWEFGRQGSCVCWHAAIGKGEMLSIMFSNHDFEEPLLSQCCRIWVILLTRE